MVKLAVKNGAFVYDVINVNQAVKEKYIEC